MGFFARIYNSTDLMNGMADRLGSDFARRITLNPDVFASKYRSMAFGCSRCTDQESCASLQTSFTHLDAAPDYCVNKFELEALVPRKARQRSRAGK